MAQACAGLLHKVATFSATTTKKRQSITRGG